MHGYIMLYIYIMLVVISSERGLQCGGSHKECPAKNADGLVVRYVMSSEGGGV